MSNQKISELRRLSHVNVQSGDLFPIVDVSETTSNPTGETKRITAGDLATYIVSGGFLNISLPHQGFQTSNGLSFEANVAPLDQPNMYCYSQFGNLGNEFSMTVRAFVPSTANLSDSSKRILLGVGSQLVGMADSGSRAYIAIQNDDLLAYVSDGTTDKTIVYSDYFSTYQNRVFEATLTKNYLNEFSFFINSSLIGTVTSAPNYINSSYVTLGNGQSGTHWNIESIIYEAHVFNAPLTSVQVTQNFYGGVRNNDGTLISSYRPENLNPGPTQWLDSVGDNHLLLPINGAEASSPTKEFNLIFFNSGSSGFLGNGTQRNVLPENYVLTDCFVYSPGAPLLSIGSTATVATYGDSGIYSFNNNRVPLVSASYGRNVLPLLELGVAHTDRSLYVFYSASAAPCTFSFQGYTSKYGVINYLPPSPTPTPTPTVTITPSAIPPSPTPTATTTPTRTPPLPPGIYLSANTFKTNESPTVFTTNTSITLLPKYKLRVKARELLGVAPNLALEHRADVFNTNNVPVNIPPVGQYTTDLYYVEYDTVPDIYGNYGVVSVNGGAPFTTVTMSVNLPTSFTPPAYPGNDVYLSATTFSLNSPPYIYTGNSSVLSSFKYKLRCKITGNTNTELDAAFGQEAVHRTVAFNNNYSNIIPPGVGLWPAELYWITYNSSYNSTVKSQPWNTVTMSIATASGFTPITGPASGSGKPNVYLSSTSGSSTTFSYDNPPYIYTTDPTVLSSPGYRLRCKARYWNGSIWELLPSGAEHRALAWNNQYQTIFPPVPGVYQFELYWIKYPGVFVGGGTVYSGTPYIIDVTITP